MNKVILMGRLTKGVELLSSANGTSYIRNSIACDRKYSKGEDKETDFFNISAFGKTAEFISKYFSKGSKILISGRLRSDSYTDKNGNKTQSVTVMIEEVSFCESKNENTEKKDNDFLNVAPEILEELPFS